MITDADTNAVYFSNKLQAHAEFYESILATISKWEIEVQLLSSTNDIWAVDYMPIQTDRDRFLQFIYAPDYLEAKRYRELRTDPGPVCQALGITPIQIPLKLDGGNAIRGRNWVILTDKVFKENQDRTRQEILQILEEAFQAKPIIIPREPGDFTGHADGILRMYDEDTVLVNDYPSNYKPKFQRELFSVLQKEGLKTIRIPFAVSDRSTSDDVSGHYLNYLQMQNFVLVPSFGMPEDDYALNVFEELFPKHAVESINCNSISIDGGVLNCISWNVVV